MNHRHHFMFTGHIDGTRCYTCALCHAFVWGREGDAYELGDERGVLGDRPATPGLPTLREGEVSDD